MKRRSFLQSVAVPSLLPEIAAAQTSARIQSPAKALLPGGGVKPLTMALDHVLTEIGDALACRRPPSSIRELELAKKSVREALLTSLGLNPFPPRTPLNEKVVGRLKRPGYSIEKVIFESRPGFFIPANIYVPEEIQ